MLKQARGTTRRYLLTLRSKTLAELPYDGSEPLSAMLWPGGDRPAIATLSVVWTTPPQIRLTVSAENTEDCEPGKYRVRVLVGETVAGEQDLEIIASPGLATAPASYCKRVDVRRLIQRIESLKDVSGLEDSLGAARDWIDAAIVRAWLDQQGGRGGTFEQITSYYAPQYHESQIRGYLADNLLVVDPHIRDACAYRAAAEIVRPLVAMMGESKVDYSKLADEFERKANNHLYGNPARIDVYGNGSVVVSLNMHATRVRR